MSQATESPVYQTQAAPAKGSRGCLYGCLGICLVTLLLAGCLIGSAYYFVIGQIEKYTSETPTALPVVEFTDEEMAELKTRFEEFESAIDEGRPAEDLVLSADEINALIQADDDLSGKAHVDIKDGKVSGDISIPTSAIPGGDGRYFNASGTFDVSLNDGELVVTLVDAEVKGEPVPEDVMEAFRHENLAKDAYNNPENAKVLRRFESVRIEDDKIIFQLRREPEAAPEMETEDVEGQPDASTESTQEAEASAEAAPASEPAEPVDSESSVEPAEAVSS